MTPRPLLWRLTPADTGPWQRIMQGALAELQGLFASDWAEWIDRPQDDFRAVLERADCWAAGWAQGQPLAVGRWEALESPGTATLMGVYALPAARGTGLAAALVRQLVARAAAQGHHRIQLDVVATNLRALRFYRRLGFAPTATPPLRNPLGLDELELALQLPRRLAA
ncbi:N-acetyltransferase family protein [Paracoccus sp. (in: a-proteobacteria)]